MYYGAVGHNDFIKVHGQRIPYWEFLDVQPDGWLSSVAYPRRDLPKGRPVILDCGAWSYKNEEVPPNDADAIVRQYLALAGPGAILIAPDHMLIDGVDHKRRRDWNWEQALRFLDVCPPDYFPMACVHGQTVAERVAHARALTDAGYRYLAIGGVAARASQKKAVLEIVTAVRQATPGAWLHVLGLSAPYYVREWRKLGVQSCDGSSHFKQAFMAGAFFTVDGMKLQKHQAVRPGESTDHLPVCDCLACESMRAHGSDTRSYGSNQQNMGRAAHNQNMLMRAQKEATRMTIGLVACSSVKREGTHPAEDLYQSPLFKKAKQWVTDNCDYWSILSAKHGIVSPHAQVTDYDVTLNAMTASQRREWADKVRQQLLPYRADRFVVLAGKNYCEWTDGFDVSRPLEGMGIGQQLQFLTGENKHESH